MVKLFNILVSYYHMLNVMISTFCFLVLNFLFLAYFLFFLQ
jgi:hypothetical protein